ncbi:hypothetical protein AN1V17_11470 [Vallitalea sediminicola]
MKERLLLLRKTLKLNQEKFGSKIELSPASISALEKGMRSITDRTIKLICTEYNVNEDWLRYGTEEMFNTSNDLLEIFSYAFNDLDEEESQFLKNFLTLNKEERQTTLKYMRNLFKNYNDNV